MLWRRTCRARAHSSGHRPDRPRTGVTRADRAAPGPRVPAGVSAS